MERDVSATGGNPSSEDEVPTSVSRWEKQTNENLPCEGERPPVRYIPSTQTMVENRRRKFIGSLLHDDRYNTEHALLMCLSFVQF